MAITSQDVLESRVGNKPAWLSPNLKQVKTLIWIYFWLLIVEGALRKWVLPFLSDPLLIIRDPVVMLIYIQAVRGGFFPKHWLVKTTVFLGLFTFVWGCVHVYAGGSYRMLIVTLYGVRTYFLHLPLIFIIGHVFTGQDVRKLGRCCLWLSIPITILMAVQYKLDPGHWLNRTTMGEDTVQITAALGKIRPPGPFSFITGPIMFYPFVIAFLLYGVMRPKLFPTWLMITSAGFVCLVQPISGSRGLVLGCASVVIAACVCALWIPKLMPRLLVGGGIIALTGLILLSTSVGKEGLESFSARWNEATEQEGQGAGARAGISKRVGSGFTEVIGYLPFIPIAGFGIGAGTNVGVKLLTGDVGFLYGEAEWTRNVMEAGPILGFAYIGFRVILAYYLLRLSYRKLKLGQPLPWLLMSCATTHLISGQTSQPTTLGFMCFIAGVSLASTEVMAFAPAVNDNRRRLMMQRARVLEKKRSGAMLAPDGTTV